MRTAILGWPQVGKSSLFKMLCGPQAHAEAYGTHVGVARVPDSRLDAIAEACQPKKTTYAALEFLDSPPLLDEPEKDTSVFGQVRGADVFAHVVRLFGEDADPQRDIAELETEFLLMDLDTVNRRLDKIKHELKRSRQAEIEHEQAILKKIREPLAAETPLRNVDLTAEEEKMLSGFKLLSAKPLLVVLNVGDDEAAHLAEIPERYKLAGLAERPGVALTEVCGQIESELVELEPAEAEEFLVSYGLKESARDRVLHTICSLAKLMTFFTVSEAECRAWLAPQGTVAVDAAGLVHSDFARRFIKAEVIAWKDLIDLGGLAAAREQGRLRLEGKETPVADGEVLYIRHTA
jgi:GTP-binding protein YchF